jgi:competence protein ComEC
VADGWVVLMALAAAGGAWSAPAVPWWVGVVVALGGWWRRSPVVVCLGVALLAAGLAHRALTGAAPLPPGPISATVTLLDDPEDAFGAVRGVARLDGSHVELWARRGAAGQLRARLAGERVQIEGRVEPSSPGAASRLARRHVRGRVTVSAVLGSSPGGPAGTAANRIRRTIADGAGVLPPTDRALFLGFVLGDDRSQSFAVITTFREAGLAHLTAVSGQNVALLLLMASPLLRRLRLRGRWLVSLGLIAWFALLTRFEPSVLRAAAMAGLAATSTYLARPASSLRLLALATTGLLLLDPLLVHAVGWWLSVGATVGIVVLARPLAAALPGPRPLALALSVTLAAQLGVAPVQVAVFGPLPLASIPANVLAGPVAGPVMVWGLPAGLVAGLVPEPVAELLHVPTLLGVRWIHVVAQVAQAAPLPSLGAPAVALLMASVAAVALPPVQRVLARRRALG